MGNWYSHTCRTSQSCRCSSSCKRHKESIQLPHSKAADNQQLARRSWNARCKRLGTSIWAMGQSECSTRSIRPSYSDSTAAGCRLCSNRPCDTTIFTSTGTTTTRNHRFTYEANSITGNLTDPSTGLPIVAANVTLQYSYDNLTWTNTGVTFVTGANGSYNVSWIPPYPGVVYFRFSHVPTRSSLSYVSKPFFEPPGLVNLSSYVSGALQGYATSAQVQAVQQSVNTLSGSIQQLNGQISSLQSSLNTATYVSYGSIVVAILAILVAIFVAARRK